MLTDSLRASAREFHKTAMDMANELDGKARSARVYGHPAVSIEPQRADEIAQMLVTMMGLSNSLIHVMGEAEVAACDMRTAVSTMRSLSLGQLIRFWLRNRKARTA